MIETVRPSAQPSSVRRTWHLLALLLAAVMSLAACDRGGECDECDDDEDCDSGRTCANFEGGYSMCADDDTESCQAP